MSLTRNGSHQYSGLNKIFGAVGAYGLYSNFDHNGANNAFNSGDHAVSGVTNKASRPSGARHPVAWRMPMKAGSLASHNEAKGTSAATLTLASGRNMAGTSDGTSAASATLQLVVSMTGTIAGTSTATGNVVASLSASGTSAGSCTATATINALAWAYGTASGSCTASLVSYATGSLAGSVSPTSSIVLADVVRINGADVTGSGTSSDKWRGA